MEIENLNWNLEYERFIEYLSSIKDEKYLEFNRKLIPGNFEILGIRIPELRKIAKKILKTDYEKFLNIPSNFYEIDILKALVIASIKDPSEYRIHFDKFILTINNWAVCDTFISSSKIIELDREYYIKRCKTLLKNEDEFLNRVAFVIYLSYFVEEPYFEEICESIEYFKSDKYYANMALAWLLSIMYVKFPKETKNFLLKASFDSIVIKYTIRKIKDSYRVTDEDKKWLKKIS